MPPIHTPPTPEGPLEQIKAWAAPIATFCAAAFVTIGAFLSSRSSNKVLTISHDTLSASDLLRRLETVEARVNTLENDKESLQKAIDERDYKIRELESMTKRLLIQNKFQAKQIKHLQELRAAISQDKQTLNQTNISVDIEMTEFEGMDEIGSFEDGQS